MTYVDYIRLKALREAYDKLPEDEKRVLASRALEEQRHREVMAMLGEQRDQISRVAQKVNRQSWWTDFSSDILANFTTDAVIYILSKCMKRV